MQSDKTINPMMEPLVKGEVHGIRNAKLTGEICLPESGAAPEIEVFADANLFGTCEISVKIAEIGSAATRHYEFSCDLSPLDSLRTHQLYLVHSDSRFDFDGKIFRYNPQIDQLHQHLQDIFHFSYYINRYLPGVQSPQIAFNHYLDEGIFQDFDPNPWFSNEFIRDRYSNYVKAHHLPVLKYLEHEKQGNIAASESFHPRRYVKQNADIPDDISPLGHYVQCGHVEQRTTEYEKLSDQIQEEISELAELDPIIQCGNLNRLNIVKYPQLSHSVYTPSIIKKICSRENPIVVAIPSFRYTDSYNAVWFVIKSLREKYGADGLVVIVTDNRVAEDNESGFRKMLKDVSVVDLETLSEVEKDKQKITLFHHVLAELAPSAIVNINSRVAWNVFEKYGRQLSVHCDLYGYLFSFEQEETRKRSGFIVDHLPYALKYLKQVYYDNDKVFTELMNLYGFSQRLRNRFADLRIPCREDICSQLKETYRATRPNRENSKKKILWIARLSSQRKAALLIRIAESMQDISFVVYGTEGDDVDDPDVIKIKNSRIPNIEYKGVFKGLRSVNINECHAFLYTSEYDGIPPVIINLMAIGMPVCATDVGGIGEIVTVDTGWPVHADSGVERYQTTLRMILSNSDSVSVRSEKGIELVDRNHTYAEFHRKFMFPLNQRDAEPLKQVL